MQKKDKRRIIDEAFLAEVVEKVLKNPTKDRQGRIMCSATIDSLGLADADGKIGGSVNAYFKAAVRKAIRELIPDIQFSFHPGLEHQTYNMLNFVPAHSLRFGDKTTERLHWIDMKLPWVYELVCEPTGRRYIGESTRPDLRRAVHYFWLRNPRKEGSSNIFRRMPLLIEDVEKHGPDSFYIELIEPLVGDPAFGWSSTTEQKWIDHYGDKAYNNHKLPKRSRRQRDHLGLKRVYDSDDVGQAHRAAWKKTRLELAEAVKKCQAAKAKFSARRIECRGKVEFDREVNALRKKWKQASEAVTKAERKNAETLAAYRAYRKK
jgi:hypothetical protein